MPRGRIQPPAPAVLTTWGPPPRSARARGAARRGASDARGGSAARGTARAGASAPCFPGPAGTCAARDFQSRPRRCRALPASLRARRADGSARKRARLRGLALCSARRGGEWLTASCDAELRSTEQKTQGGANANVGDFGRLPALTAHAGSGREAPLTNPPLGFAALKDPTCQSP